MDQPQRVMQLVPSLSVGGAERMAALLAQGLLSEGISVEVVSLGDRSDSWIEEELAQAQRDHGPERLGLHFLGKGPGLDLKVVPRLRQLIRKTRPDLVHTHLHTLKYLLPARISRRQAPIVHTVHNLAEREAVAHDRRVQTLVFGRGVAPVAIGDAVATSIQQLYGTPAQATIANGIPVADFKSPAGTRQRLRTELGLGDQPTLLTVGRLNPQKDHQTLLQALADPGLAALDVQLLVAGQGELSDTLRDRADALGLSDRVHWLGVRKDVPALMAAADLFVLSSQWEGWPLVVMEALAAGLPVVSTDVGCLAELVTKATGRLVAPGNAAALADALRPLCADLALARTLGQTGAADAAARFDVSVMTAQYLALYRRLLS